MWIQEMLEFPKVVGFLFDQMELFQHLKLYTHQYKRTVYNFRKNKRSPGGSSLEDGRLRGRAGPWESKPVLLLFVRMLQSLHKLLQSVPGSIPP